MPLRRYLCPVVDAGDFRGLIPVVATLVPVTRTWSLADGRPDASLASGTVLVEADVTDAQHTAILADVRVTAFDVNDAAGAPLPDTTTISQLAAAKRTALRNLLIANHVPFDDFTGSTPLSDVRKRLRFRFRIRRMLNRDDFDEAFTLTLGQIPDAKRNRIRLWLWERGFDVSVLRLTDTVEGALLKLLADPVLAPKSLGAAVASEAPTTPKKRSSNGRKRKR